MTMLHNSVKKISQEIEKKQFWELREEKQKIQVSSRPSIWPTKFLEQKNLIKKTKQNKKHNSML